MKIVNRTGHNVVIIDDGGDLKDVHYPAGDPIRIDTVIDFDDGEPIVDVRYGTANLPPEEDGTVYIVSLAVALSEIEREDLVVPYEQVRDNDGNVIGCRRLARPV